MKIAVFLIVAFASCKENSGKQCGRNCGDIGDRAVSFIVPDVRSKLAGMSKDYLKYMCETKNTVQTFIRCIIGRMESCVPSQQLGMLPHVEGVVESVSYLCENAKDVDLACVAASSRQKYIQYNSTATHTHDQIRVLSEPATKMNFTCGTFSTSVSRYKDSMSDCQGRSAEIIAKFMEYQTPRACDATMVRISQGLLVASLCYMWLKNII